MVRGRAAVLLAAPVFFLLVLSSAPPPAFGEEDIYGGDEYREFDAPADENAYERHRRLRRLHRRKVRDHRRGIRDNTLRDGYGMAGCGLGAVIFGARPGGVQILAATSNASLGNQTFALSSGTSHCTGGKKERWLGAYLHVNREKLLTQAARNEGEAWKTLPDLTGCAPREAVLSTLKKQWDAVIALPATRQAERVMGILRASEEVKCAG